MLIDASQLPVLPPERCDVCGHATFAHTPVLWSELVEEWGLTAAEAAYIDAQQGICCQRCGANLRTRALAIALVRWRGATGTLLDFVQDARQVDLRLLEINEAGTLHSLLAMLPHHRYGAYPEVDLLALPYEDGQFDAVVHSDTLEHVADPLLALRECRRVLAPQGALLFTAPTVLGRLSRSRAGLPPSYHGAPRAADPLMLVHSEFGADLWTLVLAAGFTSCELVPCGFPAGLAYIARR